MTALAGLLMLWFVVNTVVAGILTLVGFFEPFEEPRVHPALALYFAVNLAFAIAVGVVIGGGFLVTS